MSEPKYINADDAINCIDDITDGIDAAEFSAKWIKGFLLSFPASPVGTVSKCVCCGGGKYCCKRCLHFVDTQDSYCRHCGAKMEY